MGSGGSSSEPRAYLNYILFDQDFNRIAYDAKQINDSMDIHQKPELSVNITKGGYIYIWLSNESSDTFDVYFDDFRITHNKGSILQEDHYYPFGGSIAALSSTAPLSKPNKFKFNGNEEQLEFDLNLYDFNARMYDPWVGRFSSIDPLSELRHQSNWNPYHFSYNNPINLSDPTGLDAVGLDWSWMDDGGAETYNAAEAYGNSVRGQGGNSDSPGNSSEQQGLTSGGCPPATICPGKDGKVNLDVAENVLGEEITDNGSDPENNTTDLITINLKNLKSNMGTGAFSYGFTVMGNIGKHGGGVSLGTFYGKSGKGIFISVFEPEGGAILSGSFDMTIYSPNDPGRDVLLGHLGGDGFQLDAGASIPRFPLGLGYSRGTNAHSENYPFNFQPTYTSHTMSISTGLDFGYSQSKSRTMVFPVIPYIPILLTTFKGIR